MRRHILITPAIAVSSLVLVAGGGFVIQAAALGRPGPDPLLVVRAVARLVNYQRSAGTIVIQGRRMSFSCDQSWRHRARSAVVRLGDGTTMVQIGTRLRTSGRLHVAEFELAGCPRSLTRWLATNLNRGNTLVVSSARMFGRRVYRVVFPTGRLKLELYITRAGSFPVGLSIAGNGIHGVSELRYPSSPRAEPWHPLPPAL
jgi:hypothetical protein